jgi:hypothetical protein
MVFVVWFLGVLSTVLAVAMTLHAPKARETRKKRNFWAASILLTLPGLDVAIYQEVNQETKERWEAVDTGRLTRSNRELTKTNKDLASEVHKMRSEMPRAPSTAERFVQWINRVNPDALGQLRQHEDAGERTFRFTVREEDYISLLAITNDDKTGWLKCIDTQPNAEILSPNGKIKNLSIYIDPSLLK